MRKIENIVIAVSLCAILAGCSADNEVQTYATDRVLVDGVGLKLQPSQNMYIDFATISKAYSDTMACMGMTAPGPVVEYRSFSFAGVGGAWAFYVYAEGVIWVNTDEDDVFRKRDSRTDIEALRHEFIHHILHMNGAGNESRGHASPFFRLCGLGVRMDN